jgi:dimethylargininase
MKIIVRNIPSSFPISIKQDNTQVIDINEADKQHQNYIDVLKNICREENMVILDYDNKYPDCCFIEDILIVIYDILIITNPGAESRKGEIIDVEKYIRDNYDENNIFNIMASGTLDGGDVLIVENDIFIGITKRTNIDGFNQVKNILKNKTKYNIYPIYVESLHLKSVITYLKNNILIISDCEIGRNVYHQIENICPNKYKFIFVPDRTASNILCINDNLIIQDNFPESEKIFEILAKEYDLNIYKLNMSEFIKADGALTCCSVILL